MSSLTKPNLLLFLDWDGTITKSDTLETLAETAYAEHARRNSPHPLPPWFHFQDAYMVEYSERKKRYTPQPDDRSSIEDELKWLENLRSVEVASLKRVEVANVFKDIPVSCMVDAAHQLVSRGGLRKGADKLLATASDKKTKCHVLSGNWSKIFINAALRKVAELNGKPLEDLEIDCNDLATDEAKTVYTGRYTFHLVTATDKATLFKRLRAENENLRSVYIGDSIGDFACLVDAEVGICIRDPKGFHQVGSAQKSLAETLERLQIECVHIDRYKEIESRQGGDPKASKTMFWARDLAEIEQHIF